MFLDRAHGAVDVEGWQLNRNSDPALGHVISLPDAMPPIDGSEPHSITLREMNIRRT